MDSELHVIRPLRQRKPNVRMNSNGKTAQQTDDWQQNEDDVLRQLHGWSVMRDTVKQFHRNSDA